MGPTAPVPIRSQGSNIATLAKAGVARAGGRSAYGPSLRWGDGQWRCIVLRSAVRLGGE